MRRSTRTTTGRRRTVLALLCFLVLGPVPAAVPEPAHAITAIEAEYRRLGGTTGRLGKALAPQRCGLRDSGCYRSFERGSIHWSRASGARPTWGAIRSAWAATGWERGALGYPTGTERCAGGTCRQSFQRGTVTWTSARGTRVVREIDRAASVFVVVNKRRPLNPSRYVPGRLVDVGGQLMRADAAAAFRRMQADADAAGAPMVPVSGYRSYATQRSLYRSYVAAYGQAQADRISARPGHSEHQTGLAMDIGVPDGSCALQECFARTRAGAWAAANAHRYGFVVRYPAGHTATTGYAYEPWHLRWVGAHVARGMKEQRIPTLEHYMRLPAAPAY